MTEINLLPIELSPARGAVKIAKKLNSTIVLFVGIFLIISLFGIIFIVFLSTEISASVAKQTSLKQNIASLQATEQKLFLTKDRIDKIKLAYADKNAGDTFNTLDGLLSNLPAQVSVSKVKITESKTAFSVLSKDSLSMASFLNSLVTNGIYKNITLTSFVFSPDRGYLISLESSE